MSAPQKKSRLRLSSVWRDVKVLLWEHRKRLGLGMLLMLVNRGAGMVLPASSKYVFDEIIAKNKPEMLTPVALAIGLATIVQASTTFALSQVVGKAAQRAITEMRKRLQIHVMRLPIRYFDGTQTGMIISRIMTDPEGIRNLVGTGIIQLTGSLVTASIALSVLIYLNWKLTTVTLLVLLLFGGYMAIIFSILRPLFRKRGEITAQVTGRLSESLSGIRIVKAYTAEKREHLIFTHGAHSIFRNIAQTMFGVSSTAAFSTIIVGLIGVTMIIVGGHSMMSGAMSPGDFLMYMIFTGLIVAPLIQIAAIGTQLSEGLAGLDRIHEIMSMPTEDEEDKMRNPVTEVRGEVDFENLWFEYAADTPVLKGISFHAPAGSTTALVGSSGSGKSTLISLVMAFNRPTKGRVLIDEKDLADMRLREYRTNLGIVMQDNFLFDGTIADNIRFSKPNASREEVVAVSRIAHCDEFIEQFEQQYDTVVGERGVRLSGGQRQRIAIARAILADPSILILDEATSSLDSESEALIQDGLKALRKGRTTFVIAHRLSTIRSSDQILVLENGEIVERGTHQELIDLDGRYRQLYDKQYNWEMDKFVNPGEDFTPELPKPETTARPARRGFSV